MYMENSELISTISLHYRTHMYHCSIHFRSLDDQESISGATLKTSNIYHIYIHQLRQHSVVYWAIISVTIFLFSKCHCFRLYAYEPVR